MSKRSEDPAIALAKLRESMGRKAWSMGHGAWSICEGFASAIFSKQDLFPVDYLLRD